MYESIADYYQRRDIKSVDLLLQSPLPPDPNILFLGTDYYQDYSGMVQALSSLGNLRCFDREEGQYGLYPSLDLTRKGDAFYQNTKRLQSIVAEMVDQGNVPDIIIGQLWGGVLDVQVLDMIRNRWGTKVINIGMDDRHTYWLNGYNNRFMGSYGLVSHVDMVATSAPEVVGWCQKEGQPAVFFPEGSDPNIFRPMPHLPKKYDVLFVGACYGVRRKVVHALRGAGISVVAYGKGWKNGKLPVDDVPQSFAQSKIILGVGTIGYCSDFYALKLRDFDAPMSGSMYITSHNPDLLGLYDIGKEIITYKSIGDCIDKVQYYLKHDDERESIAQAGMLRARREHTWQKRIAMLFDLLRSS